jgi:RNAse (barnase) inhibitor barstar
MSEAPNHSSEKPLQNSSAGFAKLARKDLPALLKAADELKMAVFNVDLKNARNVPGFIKTLQRDLNFPDWFGGNLDALHDCMTDFSWNPAPGYVITLTESDGLRANPTSFAAFNAVLSSVVEEWKTRRTPFWIFYVQDDPGECGVRSEKP